MRAEPETNCTDLLDGKDCLARKSNYEDFCKECKVHDDWLQRNARRG